MKKHLLPMAIMLATLLRHGTAAYAQTTLTLTPPDTVRACDVNRFAVSFTATGTDSIAITPQIVFPAGGGAGCTTTGTGLNMIFETLAGGTVATLQQGQSLKIKITGNGTVTLTYRIEVDCHVIQQDTGNVVSLKQTFTGNHTYAVSGGTGNTISQAINYTKIAELNATANMPVLYLKDTTWIFYYKNTLSHRANIRFTFNPDVNGSCSGLQFGAITFGIGLNGNTTTYNTSNLAADTILLNAYDTLVIRVPAKATACISCPGTVARFSYQCNQSLAGCSSCQGQFDHTYSLITADNPMVNTERISPPNVTFDNSCFNDTTQATVWRYRIVNTGNCGIDSVLFTLGQNGDAAQDIKRLMLLPLKSLSVAKSSTSQCSVDTLLQLRSGHLCADLANTALFNCAVRIKNFYPNDTVLVSFELLRCSQDTPVLMNTPKYYNGWSFLDYKVKTICGVERIITGGTGFYSGTRISSQTGSGAYDVHLNRQFFPSATDLTFANGTGEQATFSVQLKGALNNGKPYVYQLLGCSLPQAQCTTLSGWLRATVVCDSNLTMPSPYSDAFFIYLSPAGDTTYYPPVYYDITLDSTLCLPKRYHYYYNLADSGMRNVLDSGTFVYTLQACCGSDQDPNPYKAEFHLLPNPSQCYTLQLPTGSQAHISAPNIANNDGLGRWLPLSDAGNTLSVHCPGCVIPGVITDHYRMVRQTFGLQDSDNDHRADNATAVITPGSLWYVQNESRLRLNTLAMGDRCNDFLRAHVQPGDGGNGGYSYDSLQSIGLRFNALQLSRIIPMGLDTMMMVPDTLELYVDDPADSIGGCIDCLPFGAGANDFITQLHIRVTGADIAALFLKTNPSLNEYLYSFTSYYDSTAMTDTGNLHLPQFVIPITTSRPFKGFFEGQSYRLRVTYHICGNFNPAGDLTAETAFRESRVFNKMWLSGKRQATSQVPQMEQNITALHALGITPFRNEVPPYTLMDTAYTNNRLFYCETRSGLLYFAATTFRNITSLYNRNAFQCIKRMEVRMEASLAGGKQVMDAFPFEYKIPNIGALSLEINVPPGYKIVQASTYTVVPVGNNYYASQPVNVSNLLPSVATGNFTLSLAALPAMNCLVQAVNPAAMANQPTAYYGDQYVQRIMDFELEPVNCDRGPIVNSDSASIVNFGYSGNACTASYACNVNPVRAKNSNNGIQDFTLMANIISPGIGNSLALAVSDTVCWRNLQLQNISADKADYVYIALAGAPPFLGQWHYVSGNTVTPANGNIIHIRDTLSMGIVLNGSVCAVLSSCPQLGDTAAFYLHYGWNCGGYPALPYNTDAICSYDSMQIKITRADYELVTYNKLHTHSFSLCDTMFVEAKFQNGKEGLVYPYEAMLQNLDPRLQVITAIAFTPSDTVHLTPTTSPAQWTIAADSVAALMGHAGMHSSEFLWLRFEMIAGCGYGLNPDDELPDIVMYATGYCGDTLSATSPFNRSSQTPFVWNGLSKCVDCWSITKTVDKDTAAAMTDTITYTITVCNNSANTQTASLVDNTPNNFVIVNSTLPPTVTLPSLQCSTYTVSGYFTTPGSCLFNVAAVTSAAGTTWKDSVCVNVVNICTNTDTVFIDGSYSGSGSVNYKSILVAGKFYVNGTFSLNNCIVYVSAGGQLIVQSGGVLNLNNSSLQSCDTLWRGIEVMSSGVLNLTGSTLSDAENGILLRHQGRTKVHDSYFYDNIIGINAQPELLTTDGYGLAQLFVVGTEFKRANGLKPGYVGQPYHGTVPLCGIWLNKMFCTIGDDGFNENHFSKLVYGIYSQNSSLSLTNSSFKAIYNHNSWNTKAKGTAVVSWGNALNTLGDLVFRPVVNGMATIDQCDRGVYASYSGVDIAGLNITKVLTGIYAVHGQLRVFDIQNNHIEAKSYGIYLSRNENALYINVDGNQIIMKGSAKGEGITLDEWNNVVSANYYINSNSITLWDAAYGIKSSYTLKPQINYNTIYQYTTGSVLTHSTGIALLGSDTATVSCNYMTTNYPSDSSNFVSIGMEIAQSKSFVVNCNKIRYHNCGVYMGGDCQNKNIYRGNDVDSCDMGLYLNGAAVIGQQLHKGNRWLNVSNKINAANVGTPSSSRIIVHAPVNTIWHPFNISPNGQWFFPQTGTPENCNNTCEAAFTNAEDTLLLYSIARDSAISTEFVDETKSIAKQNLYDLLDINDTLRNSDSVLTIFYLNNQTTSLGQFNTVKDYQKSGLGISAYFSNLLELTDSLIKITKDSLTIMDSLTKNNTNLNYEIIYENLISQLNNYQNTYKNLMQQIVALQDGNWSAGKTINASVQPNSTPETNVKTMNEILATIMQLGEDSIASQVNTILSIAMQCPYSGGVSVYLARNIIREWNDSLIYDDKTSCLQQGIYRFAENNFDFKNYTAIDFDLVPNPADHKTEVRILTPVDALTKITLRSMLGNVMDEWKLNSENKFTIYTHKYLQGIYLIEVKNEAGLHKTKKLIITR